MAGKQRAAGYQLRNKKVVSLDKNGQRYRKEGLPEKAFLTVLSEDFKGLNVITKKSKLSREEVNACIGILRKKGAIEIQPGENFQVKITEQGKKIKEQPIPEEIFLHKQFPLELNLLSKEETTLFEELKKEKNFLKWKR